MELYLDCAATTSIDKEVLEEYISLITSQYGSTGSLHSLGQQTLNLEIFSKFKIAQLLKVKPNEILFNSGATEGNNYAIKGVAFQYKNRGKTMITTKVEHPSVLQCFQQLEKDYGFHCIYLDVDKNGVVNLEQLKNSLNDDVIFVSIMYVNHEIGSIMPIKEIGQLLKKYPKIIFHTDMTQAIGKIPVDLSLVDIATMSAHKIHGIKGSGFIYKKEKVDLYPLISGHPAHNALRAGTSNWPSNVVLSKAVENTFINMKKNYERLKNCQKEIMQSLMSIPGIVINTNYENSIPNIVNFSVLKHNPEVIIRALSAKKIYVSSRSVCSVGKKDQISTTLSAMNKDMDTCISSIRMSYDFPLSKEEMDYLFLSLNEVLKETRK